MSPKYAESNDESSRELFEKRNLFQANQNLYGSPVIDFNFGEKYFYGRVDRNFIPIVLNLDLLEDFNNSLIEGTRTSDVNFVVRAFNAMAQQFKKCAMQQRIVTDDPYLSTLRIYKGNQSHESVYSAHLSEVFNAIKREFEAQDIQVKDFVDFATHFLRIFENNFAGTPFTKPAYIKSAKCPVGVSGLTVEIADLDPLNDSEKIEFMRSPNWAFFRNACRSYGFMIDANIPCRVVADIGSSPMIEYARKDGFTSTDSVLGDAYRYAHDDYFPEFPYYMLRLYQSIRAESFLEITHCADLVPNGGMPSTTTKTISPTKYTRQSFDAKFSEIDFLEMYMKIRLLETSNTGLTSFEVEALRDDCREIYESSGISKTLKIFEFIINKPFDYSGSLSYTYVKLKAMEEEKVAQMGKSNSRSATSGGSMGGTY